jgi:hypothetical protein
MVRPTLAPSASSATRRAPPILMMPVKPGHRVGGSAL